MATAPHEAYAVVSPESALSRVGMKPDSAEAGTAVDAPRAASAQHVWLVTVCCLLLGLIQATPSRGTEKPPAKSGEAWPTAVQARYRLRYNGFDVGHLDITSTTAAKSYSVAGSGKVSVLFGAITWGGSSTVSGAIDGGGVPAPAKYAFDWYNNRKGGKIQMGFKERNATEVSVTPPPDPHRDLVPLSPEHKTGVLDPVSAILMLTKADHRPPCDRRVGIFDGKQRYDIVLTYKRQTMLPPVSGKGPAESAPVCRAMYEPVAGHRANEATKTYASNRDVEVVMRRIPGSQMYIPYSVTVPTFWGTGSMVTEYIDVSTASVGRIAMKQ